MRRSIAVLALLFTTACDSPTEAPPPDATGEWMLVADAGTCSMRMRALVMAGDMDGFSGAGTLEVKKPAGRTDPHVLFDGSRAALDIHTVYPIMGAPFVVGPMTLHADEASGAHVGGGWSCDGVAGAWALDRVVH